MWGWTGATPARIAAAGGKELQDRCEDEEQHEPDEEVGYRGDEEDRQANGADEGGAPRPRHASAEQRPDREAHEGCEAEETQGPGKPR